MNKECYMCDKWKYDERIANKYGEGTGLCIEYNEPKGCNRTACCLFDNILKANKKV